MARNENYRALHAMNLPVVTIAGPDAERPGEHSLTDNRKAPGDIITREELAAARQTEDDILRLTTDHLPDGAATEGIAMCLESEYEALLAKAKEAVVADTKAAGLRAMGLTDAQIETVLGMQPAVESTDDTNGGE